MANLKSIKGYRPTLYISTNNHYCHRIRLMMLTKNIIFDVVEYKQDLPDNKLSEEEFANLPVLSERGLAIYFQDVILEYIEERYPHPPMIVEMPSERARFRKEIRTIDREISELVDKLVRGTSRQYVLKKIREELQEKIVNLSFAFDQKAYYNSDSLTMHDCVLLPILWRLPSLGIENLESSHCRGLLNYMKRMFTTDIFQNSMTDTERELREEVYGII